MKFTKAEIKQAVNEALYDNVNIMNDDTSCAVRHLRGLSLERCGRVSLDDEGNKSRTITASEVAAVIRALVHGSRSATFVTAITTSQEKVEAEALRLAGFRVVAGPTRNSRSGSTVTFWVKTKQAPRRTAARRQARSASAR